MPRSRPDGNRRWAGMLQEFFLIFVGVTLALGADSFWSERQDQARVSEYLDQLGADLEENSRRLREAISDEEGIGSAATTALLAAKSGSEISVDSARAWLVERRGFYYSDPRLLEGTFSGLTSSGDLRLIADPRLRNAIIAYLPQVSADRAEFDRWVGIFLDDLSEGRSLVHGLDDYAPAMGDGVAAAFAANPRHPAMVAALDSQVWTHQVRLIYLRRMLDATEQAAEVVRNRRAS